MNNILVIFTIITCLIFITIIICSLAESFKNRKDIEALEIKVSDLVKMLDSLRRHESKRAADNTILLKRILAKIERDNPDFFEELVDED